MKNPFIAMRTKGRALFHTDAESRLQMVSKFDLPQCRAALEIPDLQIAVKKRIEARIRKLEKLNNEH